MFFKEPKTWITFRSSGTLSGASPVSPVHAAEHNGSSQHYKSCSGSSSSTPKSAHLAQWFEFGFSWNVYDSRESQILAKLLRWSLNQLEHWLSWQITVILSEYRRTRLWCRSWRLEFTMCEIQNSPRNISFHWPALYKWSHIHKIYHSCYNDDVSVFQRSTHLHCGCLNWLLLVGFCKYLKGGYMELEAVLIGSNGNMAGDEVHSLQLSVYSC